MHRFSPEQIAAMTAWQRRRFERLGLIPAVSSAARAAVDDPPAHPEPTTPTAEHVASGAVPRSLGGDDVADNLIPLCSADHRLVTDHRPGRLRIVTESLTDAGYAYVVGKLGEGGPARLFGVGR